MKLDPENEDLLNLKSDLESGLKIAAELMQENTSYLNNSHSNSQTISRSPEVYDWKLDDICMAPLKTHGNKLFPAKIVEIDEANNRCTLNFLSSDEHDTYNFQLLQKITHAEKEEIIRDVNIL